MAESYYRIIRGKGYSDELNVSEDELRRMLGVVDLRYDNSGYAELDCNKGDILTWVAW